MNTLQQKIESLLFYKNEPISFSWLARQLDRSIKEIEEELYEMLEYYDDRGINLVITENKAALFTSEISSDLIQKISKSNEEKELSKQALETISIIIYAKEITKAEIDYIRGVNSVYILRNLLMRGLVEKKENREDKRSPLYVVTSDTLNFLGITRADDLPDYEHFSKKLLDFENQAEEDKTQEEDVTKTED